MNEITSPAEIDPSNPPCFRIVMQTQQELPPELLMNALGRTFALDDAQARKLALPILRYEMVPHGAFSREIAEAKAFVLHRYMLERGRMLKTSISPCI